MNDDLAGLLAIADAPLPTTPDERRAAIAEAEAALDQLDTLRTDTDQALTAALARRRTALLTADDRVISKLDVTIAELERNAERFDLIEERLIARCSVVAEASRADGLAALIADYQEAVEVWAQAMSAATLKRKALISLRDRAVQEGHEQRLGAFDLPHPQFPSDLMSIENFRVGAIMQVRQMTAKKPPAPTYPVTFTESFPGGLPHRAGETAAFDAAVAHMLVEAGHATWADSRRRPSRPAAKGAA